MRVSARHLPFHLVDVFAPATYSGNPLPVVMHNRELDGAQMLRIAREFRQFETVFLAPLEQPGHWEARVFDLVEELAFAGHPLLGAAAVLHARGDVERRRRRDAHGGFATHPSGGRLLRWRARGLARRWYGRPWTAGDRRPGHPGACVWSRSFGFAPTDAGADHQHRVALSHRAGGEPFAGVGSDCPRCHAASEKPRRQTTRCSSILAPWRSGIGPTTAAWKTSPRAVRPALLRPTSHATLRIP